MFTKKLIFASLLLLFYLEMPAQDSLTNKLNFKPPGLYAGFSFGAFEIYSFLVEAKISERISGHIRWGYFDLSSEGAGGPAFLVGVNYYFNRLAIFRYASVNAIYIHNDCLKGGYGLQWVLGNSTDFEDGFGFMYEVGAMYHPVFAPRQLSYGNDIDLLVPVVKIGWIYNF